jgi:methyl-accepting chemotaxis protein
MSKVKKSIFRILKYIENTLRIVNIPVRLITSFIIVSLLPLVITGYISFIKSSTAIESKISSYSSEIVNQLSKNIGTEISKINSDAFDIIFNEDILSGIDNLSTADAISRLDLDKKITRMFTTTIANNSAIYCMQIYVDQVHTYKSKSLNISDNTFESLYKKVTGSESKNMWSIEEDSGENHHLVFSKNITSKSNGSSLGMINIFVKPELLDKILKEVDLGNGSEIIIINSKGIIISTSNSKSNFGSIYNEKSLIENVLTSKKNFSMIVDGNKKLIAFSKVKNTDYYLIAEIPYSFLNYESNIIRNIIIFTVGVCIILALFLSFFISKSIYNPLKQLTKLIDKAEKGILTDRIEDSSKDEIGYVVLKFNKMVENIKSLIIKVSNSANDVSIKSEEIESTSKQSHLNSEQIALTTMSLTDGVTNQAHEGVNSIDQMNDLSSNINTVQNEVDIVSKVIYDTKERSRIAMDIIVILKEKADSTSKASGKIIYNINSLNNDMGKINQINKLIKTIAVKTNLLALNARIEAAKSGASGRGFIIIAEEIKKLADQSKNESIAINSIIKNILAKTELSVEEAELSDKTIKEQMVTVKEVDSTFDKIFEEMTRITEQINNVNGSIKKMQLSREITCKSVDKISKVTQDIASGMEEVSASTQEQAANADELSKYAKTLNKMSKELNSSISIFAIDKKHTKIN